MSRRSPRFRVRFAATVYVEATGAMLVCQTRDISRDGCFLETSEQLATGARIGLTVMDAKTGGAVVCEGVVVRALAPRPDGTGLGVGVKLSEPPPAWRGLVSRYQREADATVPGIGTGGIQVRLRVIVVGDDERRRGALALYVTSGWDVRFASDLEGAREALTGGRVDAVIAEHDLQDARWPPILTAAREAQPQARRIVRAALRDLAEPARGGPDDLVHRVVDLEAGLDALCDALTADFGASGPAPRGAR